MPTIRIDIGADFLVQRSWTTHLWTTPPVMQAPAAPLDDLTPDNLSPYSIADRHTAAKAAGIIESLQNFLSFQDLAALDRMEAEYSQLPALWQWRKRTPNSFEVIRSADPLLLPPIHRINFDAIPTKNAVVDVFEALTDLRNCIVERHMALRWAMSGDGREEDNHMRRVAKYYNRLPLRWRL